MWRCRNCGREYAWERVHPACPVCLGPLDRTRPITFDPMAEEPEAPGLWRYRRALGLPESEAPLSLGEGRTPLQPVQGQPGVYVKREDLNPTGSVKDRAASVLFTWARAQGVRQAATVATPNTLRSWRAYARRAGVRLQAYAARLPQEEPLPRALPVRSLAEDWHEVLHTLHREQEHVLVPYHPLALDAYATIAYEVVAQLGRAPGTVVVPVGQAAVLLGVGRGFVALHQAGVIDTVPRLMGVEPLARAGLWAMARGGRETHLWVRDPAPAPTVEAGRRFPWWGDLALPLVAWSQGRFVAVDDEAWAQARDALQRAGLYLQPEAALVWAAWVLHGREWVPPVVLVFTGGAQVGSRTRRQPWWQRILFRRREVL